MTAIHFRKYYVCFNINILKLGNVFCYRIWCRFLSKMVGHFKSNHDIDICFYGLFHVRAVSL